MRIGRLQQDTNVLIAIILIIILYFSKLFWCFLTFILPSWMSTGILPPHPSIHEFVWQQRTEQFNDLHRALKVMSAINDETPMSLCFLKMFLLEEGRLPLEEEKLVSKFLRSFCRKEIKSFHLNLSRSSWIEGFAWSGKVKIIIKQLWDRFCEDLTGSKYEWDIYIQVYINVQEQAKDFHFVMGPVILTS